MRLCLVAAVAHLASVHGLALHAGGRGGHVRSGAVTMSLIDDIASKLPFDLPFAEAADADPGGPRGVVVTGGANGVGYAYADSFMKRGHSVVICDVKDPAAAVAALTKKYEGSSAKVFGTICDVSDAASVEELGEYAKASLGTIHYWINNAGINGGRRPFTSLSTSTLEAVVNVNLIGVLLCTKVWGSALALALSLTLGVLLCT